jgi:hypothetical protein
MTPCTKIPKVYKPAELVAAVEAVQKTGYASDSVAREMIIALHQLGYKLVYVGDAQPRKRTHFETDGCNPPEWYGPTGE